MTSPSPEYLLFFHDSYIRKLVLSLTLKHKAANDWFFSCADVTGRTQKIADELRKLSNESRAMNTSASDAVDFMLESISDAKSQTSRANNLKNSVEQTFNESESVAVDVKNSTEVTEGLSKMLEQFNDDLNRTKTRINEDKLQLKTTRVEIEAVKVVVRRLHCYYKEKVAYVLAEWRF